VRIDDHSHVKHCRLQLASVAFSSFQWGGYKRRRRALRRRNVDRGFIITADLVSAPHDSCRRVGFGGEGGRRAWPQAAAQGE